MGREENTHRASYSGGGGTEGGGGRGGGCSSGGRSKKAKQKKVPQRGLGVAQLEKIRLEEQQKKDAALQAANLLAESIVSPSEPNFRTVSSNTIPLAPPSPNNLPSPVSSHKLVQSIPDIEFRHPHSAQFSKPLIVGAGEFSLPPISGAGQGSLPRLWNGEYNLAGRDHHGFTVPSHVNLPYEFNPRVLHIPQRVYQFQLPTSSSMVNASSAISSSSSSALNFQMEPPSNQRYLGNNYIPFWPEEEKMVGIKRSYPFSMETPPAPSFQGKFHPAHLVSISESDESGSCSNGCTTQIEPRVKHSRNGPLNSTPRPEQNLSEVIRENRELNGDFLTLGPPAAASSSSPLNSNHKHLFAYSRQHIQELSDYQYIPSKESTKDRYKKSVQETPFTFFPSKVQIDQGKSYVDNSSGDKRETIDLNLKL